MYLSVLECGYLFNTFDKVVMEVKTFVNPKKPCEPETTRKARLIEVIETVSVRGNGVNTVFREVIQYWSKDGKLLAENDRFERNDKIEDI